MARSFPLQPLQHLAKQKSDAAAKKLGQLNRNRQSAEGKLEMLQQYRRDYLDKMRQAELAGMDLQDLRNYREFIYRLDEAIAQQHTVVEQAHKSVSYGQGELMETQRRMKSFDALAQRHLDAENKKEAKREQKIQDEHSSRRAAFRNAEHNDPDNTNPAGYGVKS